MKVLLFLIVFTNLAAGQSDEAKRMVGLINDTYKSDSAVFIFDLEAIPASITSRILRMTDSMYYRLHKEKKTLKLKEFMANTYGKWNATDNLENEKWPMRRFIYGVKSGTRWIIIYEHGGIGNHYHVVYFDTHDNKSISTSTTLANARQIHEWIWEHKIEEIKKRTLVSLIDEDDLKLLNGRLIENFDVW